jgi:transposase
VQEWAEIRHLHFAEGSSAWAIAVKVGVARDTVARALRSESPPRYSRPSSRSAFDGVEPRVRELLAEFLSMPATVLAERVGWTGRRGSVKPISEGVEVRRFNHNGPVVD